MDLYRINQDKVYYYLKRYLQEIVENFIAFSVYDLLMHKNFNLKKSSYMALISGVVTLFLEEYDQSYKQLLKNGIIMAIGSQLVKF